MTISDADFMAFKPMFDAIQLAIEKADCSERVVTIAVGLRMVADAIDPPPMAHAMREVAETLRMPVIPDGPLLSRRTVPIVDALGCRRIIVRQHLHGRSCHDDGAVAASLHDCTRATPAMTVPITWWRCYPVRDSNRFGPCAICGRSRI